MLSYFFISGADFVSNKDIYININVELDRTRDCYMTYDWSSYSIGHTENNVVCCHLSVRCHTEDNIYNNYKSGSQCAIFSSAG